MTLACEEANSKLVDVVTVADVENKDRVGNSLLQICRMFGQDFEVDIHTRFEAGVWSVFRW